MGIRRHREYRATMICHSEHSTHLQRGTSQWNPLGYYDVKFELSSQTDVACSNPKGSSWTLDIRSMASGLIRTQIVWLNHCLTLPKHTQHASSFAVH